MFFFPIEGFSHRSKKVILRKILTMSLKFSFCETLGKLGVHMRSTNGAPLVALSSTS